MSHQAKNQGLTGWHAFTKALDTYVSLLSHGLEDACIPWFVVLLSSVSQITEMNLILLTSHHITQTSSILTSF